MKKVIPFTILFGALISGCAKKTYTLNSSRLAKQTTISTDSVLQQKAHTIDRSVILTHRDIDTIITTTGKLLTGYISPMASNKADLIFDARFENDDVSLYLQTNKTTGITKAVVTPKPKSAIVKIHESTLTKNNIHTDENNKSTLKTNTKINADSAGKIVTSYKNPTAAIKSFKTVSIWFLLAITLVGGVIYTIKKMSLFS